MKKNILLLMCGLLSFSMLFTACSDDETIIPEFPSAVSETIASEGTYTLTIAPNMDWSLELTNKTDFYIQDGPAKVWTMQGKAGEYTIKVCANAIEDFDADHTCGVELTMGSETKSIAALTVKKTDRVVKVYAAKVEDGAYVGEEDDDENFIYEYSTETAETLAMVYSLEEGYTSVVKVNTNFDFAVVTPEWLQPVSGGKANVDTEIVFEIDPENYPAAGTEEKIKIVDANNAEKVAAEVTIAFEFAPHTLRVSWIEEPAFFDVAEASHWAFGETALEDYDFMNYYEAYYASKWDSETGIRTSKQIKSFAAYSCTETSGSAFVEITGENSWLSLNYEFEAEEASQWTYIVMDDTKATAEAAKNENTGELEGVLVIEFVDGSYTAVYCHYKAPTAVGGGDGVVTLLTEWAEMCGIFFNEVAEGDEDYDIEWAYSGVAQYRLTFTMQGMPATLGVPAGSRMMTMSEWIMYEPGEDNSWYVMANPEAIEQIPATGTLQIVDSSWNTIAVVYCVFNAEM